MLEDLNVVENSIVEMGPELFYMFEVDDLSFQQPVSLFIEPLVPILFKPFRLMLLRIFDDNGGLFR